MNLPCLQTVNVLQKSQQVWGGNTLLWNGASDPCLDSWPGVICNSINTIVTSLYGLLPSFSMTFHACQKLQPLTAHAMGGQSFRSIHDACIKELETTSIMHAAD